MTKFLKKGISILIASSMILSICNLSSIDFSFAENNKAVSKTASQNYGGFNYEIKNGNAVIIGKTSDTTIIDIPSSINGYTVTEIGDNAFMGSEITSVKLPNTLKVIGERSFATCKQIKSVVIPNSVTTIKDCAFLWCNNLSSVVFSNNLRTIEYKAFALCENLKNISIPEGVKNIEEMAFYGSYKLKTATIPNSVTSMGEKVFNSKDMTIYGTSGSYAQTYAKNNNLKFVAETTMSSTGLVTGNVNIRTGASTGYPSVGYLSKGTKVQVVAKNSETGWYKIKYNGNYAYASYKYIKLNSSEEDLSVIKTGVTTSSINVRKGPSTSYSKLGSLSKGTKVQIVAIDNSTGWYKIKYKSGYGYISYKYVKLDGEKATSTLKITNANYPTTISEGSSFTLKGKISSNYKITYVRVQILNSAGNAVPTASKTVYPNSYSYSKIDSGIKFGTLVAGNYTYQIIAKDSSGTQKVLVNKNFSVKGVYVIKTGITTSSVSVRKGPSTSYSKLGSLSKGTKVQIVAIDNSTGWYKIKYKNGYGYISYKYVKLDGSQSSYKNYVGNWYCTIKYNEGRVTPAQDEYQIKIKSISGNKVTFDYNAYTSSGSATLGTENKNIKETIKNGKVTFYYRDYYNIVMNNYSNKKLKGTLYLKNGYVYLTSKDGGVNINYLKLTKAGRVVRK